MAEPRDKGWCKKCAAFQSLSNVVCEKCGAPMPGAGTTSSPILLPILTLIILGVVLSAAGVLFGSMGFILTLVLCSLVAIVVVNAHLESKKLDSMNPDERTAYKIAKQARADTSVYGPINDQIICPHCQQRGGVRTKNIEQKVGISGAKATGAILTGGVSLLATGLSRKREVTSARCGNCSSDWQF
jgi:hypothetical protein